MMLPYFFLPATLSYFGNAPLEQLPNLTELTEAERTTLIESLLELVREQKEKIRQLEEEIKELKKLNKRPKLRPSKIDQQEKAEEARYELQLA